MACHVHSDWSYDGKWSLPDLAPAFGRRGYQVVMMTEHDRGFDEARWTSYRAACSEASSEKILFVPGIEYSDPANVIHVLVWGCPLFLGESLSTSSLLEAVRTHQALAVLAHPSRRDAWQVFDPSWANNLLGIEMWNRKMDGWAPSRSAPALLKNAHLMRFAGLDFHDQRQFFPLSMRISVGANVTEESVLKAFQSRHAIPYAFGQPLTEVLHPAAGLALSAAECVRRTLAKSVHYFRSSSTRRRAVAKHAAT